MNIYFQKKDFNISKELNNFSKKNKKVGSIISFVGKVRPSNNKKKIESMEIDCYKKMAIYQTKKIIDILISRGGVVDYQVIHRFGKLFPSENIILILVASKHRKEGFFFIEKLIKWFKSKITFWKKEFYLNSSTWLESQK